MQSLGDAGADLEAIRIVEPDHPVRRVQYGPLRSVVAPEDDRACPDVAVLEREDVVHCGTTEGVDRLIVVPDDGHVAVLVGEDRDEFGLGAVRVLELVHQQVLEAPGDRGSGLGRRAHQAQRQGDLVPEVDAAVLGHESLIRGVGPRQLALPTGPLEGRGRGIVRWSCIGVDGTRGLRDSLRLGRHTIGVRLVVRGTDVLVLAAAEQRRQRREEPRRIAERTIGVQLELEQVLAQEDDHLGTGQDADVGRQAQLERVLADQAVAEGMERRDGGVRVAVWHELVHPDGHLLGRLVGEGQGQDLRWPGAPCRDEPRDPSGDDLGLAGPGAGHDQQRALAMRDGA